ncbi:MAG: prolyl oligopeptidase family serine peptidase [Vitreoscilla sp.]
MSRSNLALRTICAALAAASSLAQAATTAPPVAPVKAVTDSYFGTDVTDTYRYMEDLSSPDVQQWARAQAEHARATLDAIPGRAALLARIRELDDSVKERVQFVALAGGGLVFYEKRGADDNQLKLYVRQGWTGTERLLVDPDALAKADGVPHAIEFFQASNNGRYVAYALSAGGSEEAVIHVMDVATGKDVMAPIDRAHYSYVTWLPDDSGFFYMRLQALPKDAPETDKYKHASAYFHRMKGGAADVAVVTAGTDAHMKIAAAEMPVVMPVVGTAWTVAIPANGVENEIDLYAAPMARAVDPKLKWRRLFGRESQVTGFAIHGDDLYLLTHLNASRYKVIRTSVSHPDLALADVVVAPGEEVVDRIAAAKDGLYIQSRDATVGKLYRLPYAKDAQPEPVRLPAAGAVRIVDSDLTRAGVVISIDSWTHDEAFYSVAGGGGAVTDTGLQVAGKFGAPGDLVAEEVKVKSHDGLEIPLSIVHRKDMKLDGSNPLILEAYGAYGVVDTPGYAPRELAWYELGGVYATCHVRGGGIYGENWHLAGKQLTKPNTWKDAIACGQWLVKNGYTSSAKMALDGGSAGGITVGRAVTERPDLFAVAVPEVGVLNAVRAETSANGVPNIPEFGSVKDKQQFNGLLEMDAFHHVQDGVKYPATLLTTGINDPRVPAWESMKMAARLQAASTSGKPVLLRIQYDGGHGIGSTKKQRQELAADRWSFMLWQFGDARFQPAAK